MFNEPDHTTISDHIWSGTRNTFKRNLFLRNLISCVAWDWKFVSSRYWNVELLSCVLTVQTRSHLHSNCISLRSGWREKVPFQQSARQVYVPNYLDYFSLASSRLHFFFVLVYFWNLHWDCYLNPTDCTVIESLPTTQKPRSPDWSIDFSCSVLFCNRYRTLVIRRYADSRKNSRPIMSPWTLVFYSWVPGCMTTRPIIRKSSWTSIVRLVISATNLVRSSWYLSYFSRWPFSVVRHRILCNMWIISFFGGTLRTKSGPF